MNFFCSPQSLIIHLERYHDIEIIKRPIGKRRPVSHVYLYVKQPADNYVTHFACPSCWFHCKEDMDTFSHHIMETHLNLSEHDNLSEYQELAESVVSVDFHNQDDAYYDEGSMIRNKFIEDDRDISSRNDEFLCMLEGLAINFKRMFT
jgi:hypothetical protein